MTHKKPAPKFKKVDPKFADAIKKMANTPPISNEQLKKRNKK